MPAERFWTEALQRSQSAQASGALVPLATEVVQAGLEPFVLRRLLSSTPKHLRAGGPKPNPFLPWESELEVCRLGSTHVLLLNKYPVQLGHVLIITAGWQPQSGWLNPADWQAVCRVNRDTTGLWFFNSSAAAGASQPHRHLQLLPRRPNDPCCPLGPLYEDWLAERSDSQRPEWSMALSKRLDPNDPEELAALYAAHGQQLGLGDPATDPVPRAPYNLLFTNRWLLTVRRRHEQEHGFSINALGFAGYLLATPESDQGWLHRKGGWELLRRVAAPFDSGSDP